jgi:bifunctional DNA-binding transcriptional regulator/antitoxin component of YhaV-PrlF toxin-antitoxin module
MEDEDMAGTIHMTTKRQATLPAALCREMGVRPGDDIRLEKRIIDGKAVWILEPDMSEQKWFGSLKEYAKGKRHDMVSIRSSVRKRWGEEI